MVTVLPPFHSVFHTLCGVTSPSVFSATRAPAALPQLASYKLYSGRFIDVGNDCHDNPLVVPGYSPSKRYQPYPQPRILATGRLLVFGQRDITKHYEPQCQFVDPQVSGGVVQPVAPICVPHPEYDTDVTMIDDPALPSAEDYDVEMGEANYTPEVDSRGVEVEDDCLLPIPAIIVTPPNDSGQEPFVFD